MTINVTIHLIDGNTYRYEYRPEERASTPREVADQLARELWSGQGQAAVQTLQRADDAEGRSFTIVPTSAIVRIEVTDQPGSFVL